MLKPLARVLLLVFLAINLSACNLASIANDTTGGSQIVIPMLSDPKTFNPAISKESPNINSLVFEGLVRENPITGEIEPALAESWEIQDGGLKIVFQLQKNLKWADGAPLTADDVVFSYNDVFLNEAIPSNAKDSLRVGESGAFPEITKLNDRRIEFKINEPFAPFLATNSLPILPRHVLLDKVNQKDEEGNPLLISTWQVSTNPGEIVGAGPYRIKDYIVGQRVIFERNPYYWKNPKPYINRVVWEIVENTDTSLLQFRSGSLDVVGISPEYYSLLKQEEDRLNFTIYNGGPQYGTSFIAFNLNRAKRNGTPLVTPYKSAWFNNVNFRKAIVQGIDRQRMVNNIYRGLGEIQNSPISVQAPFYGGDELSTYPFDLAQAKALLAQEGFYYQEDKLFDRDNHPVEFDLITNAGNRIREAMGSQIKEDLAKLGIEVKFTPIAFNLLVSKLSDTLDWECHLIGLTGGNEPNDGANVWFPDGQLHLFNQKPSNDQEFTDWQPSPWEERIGQLFIDGAKEIEFDKRKAIYVEAQKIIADQLPLIYLVNGFSFSAIRDRVQEVQYSGLGGATWNIDELKIQD